MQLLSGVATGVGVCKASFRFGEFGVSKLTSNLPSASQTDAGGDGHILSFVQIGIGGLKVTLGFPDRLSCRASDPTDDEAECDARGGGNQGKKEHGRVGVGKRTTGPSKGRCLPHLFHSTTPRDQGTNPLPVSFVERTVKGVCPRPVEHGTNSLSTTMKDSPIAQTVVAVVFVIFVLPLVIKAVTLVFQAAVFAVSVVAFTLVVLLPLALILTYFGLRYQSVDDPQALHRLKGVSPEYFAPLVLPGGYFWVNLQDAGHQSFLVGLNLLIWLPFIAYCGGLLLRTAWREWHHQRQPSVAEKVLNIDGSVNMQTVVKAARFSSATRTPPSWKSRNHSRSIRAATARIDPKRVRQHPVEPPEYPSAQVRDMKAATRTVVDFGDLAHAVGEYEEQRGYEQTKQRSSSPSHTS